MTKAYISGPMSGYADFNYPAFFSAAKVLSEKGLVPVNPAEGVTDQTLPYWWYMRRAVRLLLWSDEIWMLPGWERSPGAYAEWHIAKQLSMPIHYFNPMEVDHESDKQSHDIRSPQSISA